MRNNRFLGMKNHFLFDHAHNGFIRKTGRFLKCRYYFKKNGKTLQKGELKTIFKLVQ